VHEAYLRLVDVDCAQQWNSRGHFFAAAAEAMRRILVERARQKKSLKHGGQWQRRDLPLDGIADANEGEDLLAIDAALSKLSIQNPTAAKLVEMRYFSGLSAEESAAALGISTRTTQRYWIYAKAWLLEELRNSGIG
jgi:RNA polymerase sigma factor (TIGR02999 family)